MKFGQWFGFISLLFSLYILWNIRQLLLLAFTAIIFVVALNRLVKFLQRFQLRRNYAIALSLSLTLFAFILFFWLVVPPFAEQFKNLIALLPKVWEQIRDTLLYLRQQDLPFDWLPQPPSQADLNEQLPPIATEIVKNFFAIFSNSITAILQLLFIFVITLMMLANPQGYRKIFIKLFPSFYRRRADEIMTLTEDALICWLAGVSINCLFIGTLSGVVLYILQIKLVLVHALLAGLLNFIPNIGPATSVVFPIMVALLDDPWKIVAIIIAYFVIQNIESYWLTPMVMAKQVSLLPAMTLMAQIFFAQLFGFLGLLLALPLTVVAKTWLDEVLLKDVLDHWELMPKS